MLSLGNPQYFPDFLYNISGIIKKNYLETHYIIIKIKGNKKMNDLSQVNENVYLAFHLKQYIKII